MNRAVKCRIEPNKKQKELLETSPLYRSMWENHMAVREEEA